MKSTARFFGHPIHPMLIPYPFAFLSGAAAFNVAAAARGNERFAQTARHLRSVGIASAVAAALPGIVDYFGTVPAGRPRETATLHALSNLTALGLFTASALTEHDDAPPRPATVALELAGTVMLSIGGWLGGELSYHHQVGVDPDQMVGSLNKPVLTDGSAGRF
jgi:uncharacterized membrane protein